jgi:hypothetical protein
METKLPLKWDKAAVRRYLDNSFGHLDDQDLYLLTSFISNCYIDGRIDGINVSSEIWQESYKSAKEMSHV